MSAHQWKPGDVAMVPGLGLVFADEDGVWRTPSRKTSTPWRDLGDGRFLFPDIHPLVVIDPEDREQVERLSEAFAAVDCLPTDRVADWQQVLRSLIADPKPDEPQGLGAVVEDADGKQWVRAYNGGAEDLIRWRSAGWEGYYRHWDAIPAVRVLSEGVAS